MSRPVVQLRVAGAPVTVGRVGRGDHRDGRPGEPDGSVIALLSERRERTVVADTGRDDARAGLADDPIGDDRSARDRIAVALPGDQIRDLTLSGGAFAEHLDPAD